MTELFSTACALQGRDKNEQRQSMQPFTTRKNSGRPLGWRILGIRRGSNGWGFQQPSGFADHFAGCESASALGLGAREIPSWLKYIGSSYPRKAVFIHPDYWSTRLHPAERKRDVKMEYTRTHRLRWFGHVTRPDEKRVWDRWDLSSG